MESELTRVERPCVSVLCPWSLRPGTRWDNLENVGFLKLDFLNYKLMGVPLSVLSSLDESGFIIMIQTSKIHIRNMR